MANICHNHVRAYGPCAETFIDALYLKCNYSGKGVRNAFNDLEWSSPWVPDLSTIKDTLKKYEGLKVVLIYSEPQDDKHGEVLFDGDDTVVETFRSKGVLRFGELEFIYLMAEIGGKRPSTLFQSVERMEASDLDIDDEIPNWDRLKKAAGLVIKGLLRGDDPQFVKKVYDLLEISEYRTSEHSCAISPQAVQNRRVAEDYLVGFLGAHEDKLKELYERYINC